MFVLLIRGQRLIACVCFVNSGAETDCLCLFCYWEQRLVDVCVCFVNSGAETG